MPTSITDKTQISKGDLVTVSGPIQSEWTNSKWIELYTRIRDNQVPVKVLFVASDGRIDVEISGDDRALQLPKEIQVTLVFTK